MTSLRCQYDPSPLEESTKQLAVFGSLIDAIIHSAGSVAQRRECQGVFALTQNILEVNGESEFAHVKPGVTFFDLYDHLAAKGLSNKLWVDAPDVGGGSIIDNAVE